MVAYKPIGYHLQVGEITKVQGWILHISVVRWQITELLEAILLTLTSTRVAFKIVKDRATARIILDGSLGHSQVGKVISVYPESNDVALFLAKKLIELTRPFKGPLVLTDIHLGGNVYTRYGSFQPIILSNADGREEKFIYDHEGQLIPDTYPIPFILPKGIQWPFEQIATPVTMPEKKILHRIYKPISTLKSDAKGNVYKALYLRKLFLVKWCVIKQGKKNMWSDEAGRDIPDRLLWQQELHNKLIGIIPIPKVLDFFVEDSDAYLAMEYVEGPSLHNRIQAINKNGSSWDQLPSKDQLTILDYLLQIIAIIEQLHQNGYVHRDITPVNFLVNKEDRLILIDSELAYSLNDKKPYPPFEAGTHGFMSPEQITVSRPTCKEDIYGLGATMITLFTGLSPVIFTDEDLKLLIKKLYFFIQNKSLAEEIAAALSHDPAVRPSIHQIKNIVRSYQESILEGKGISKRPTLVLNVEDYQLKAVISGAIEGLAGSPTVLVDALWHSRTPCKEAIPGKVKNEFSITCGLSEGIAGVLYFLARAKKAGWDIGSCQKGYEKGWSYLGSNYLTLLPDIAPGLYGGAAGIALALAYAIHSGLAENNDENRLTIKKCFELPPIGPNLMTGSAGQGVAALQCAAYLEKNVLEKLLKQIVEKLFAGQLDGSHWVEIGDSHGKRSPALSFSYGNTGIIWFLLEYADRYKDNDVQKAAIISLDKLATQTVMLKKLIKEKGWRKASEDPQARDSTYGIIMALIKAYEILLDPRYKRLAEDLLIQYPPFIVQDNLTQESGLSGLGELYLEAWKVFQNIEWKIRADWIAQFVIHTCIQQKNGPYYWLGNNNLFPTADFMEGNSGVIHFLMRYFQHDKIGIRLLK